MYKMLQETKKNKKRNQRNDTISSCSCWVRLSDDMFVSQDTPPKKGIETKLNDAYDFGTIAYLLGNMRMFAHTVYEKFMYKV